jgi:hypothetical protein
MAQRNYWKQLRDIDTSIINMEIRQIYKKSRGKNEHSNNYSITSCQHVTTGNQGQTVSARNLTRDQRSKDYCTSGDSAAGTHPKLSRRVGD